MYISNLKNGPKGHHNSNASLNSRYSTSSMRLLKNPHPSTEHESQNNLQNQQPYQPVPLNEVRTSLKEKDSINSTHSTKTSTNNKEWNNLDKQQQNFLSLQQQQSSESKTLPRQSIYSRIDRVGDYNHSGNHNQHFSNHTKKSFNSSGGSYHHGRRRSSYQQNDSKYNSKKEDLIHPKKEDLAHPKKEDSNNIAITELRVPPKIQKGQIDAIKNHLGVFLNFYFMLIRYLKYYKILINLRFF